MQSMMTVKGQVTVPKHVRERLGLRANRPVRFVENGDGEFVIRAVAAGDDDLARRRADMLRRIDSLADLGGFGMTTDEFMATIRQPLEPFEIEAFKSGKPLV